MQPDRDYTIWEKGTGLPLDPSMPKEQAIYSGKVGIDGCKRCEIVLAHNERGGLLHGVFIERIGMVRDIAREERRYDIAAPDTVVIRLAARRVAGMKIGAHLLDGEDADRGRQAVVEDDTKIGRWDGARSLKGGDLGESVHSGVGASRALGQQPLAGEAFDGLGQRSLNGGLAGLHLPAVVGGTIVGESEFEGARHKHRFRSSRFQSFKVSRFQRKSKSNGKHHSPAQAERECLRHPPGTSRVGYTRRLQL